MQTVIEQIEQRKQRVAGHPFYRWLADAEAPLARRFDFAPVLVNFIMAFSDMNKWFMRYPAPANDHERAINRHTREDETHSRLFVEDWRKLGLDGRLGWGAGDTLAWYHAAPETEAFRRHGMRILEMLTCNEDPLVRFALMESIEAWGHVMFSASAGVASALTRESGAEYRYFGPYHLKRELGHLLGGGCLFESATLGEGRRARALTLVHAFFDIADEESDRLLAYAGQVTGGGGFPRPRLPDEEVAGEQAASLADGRRDDSVGRVARVLDERRRRAAEHPLFAWMRAEDGVDPADKLRSLALFWAPDCLGYRDLNVHALTYERPADACERAINRRCAALGSHHRLFLGDWAALGMDARLGFSASDTLDFYCRSRHSEEQRRSMAAFVKLAFRHPGARSRYWLLEALEASGEAFFAGTRVLAGRVEAAEGVRLDYLADRHAAAHPRQARDAEADAVEFRGLRFAADEEEIAVGTIDTVFDCLDRQLSCSLELAAGGARL
jgi:hypothetical protein